LAEDVEQDRQRAEVFDPLGHPARITILKALSVEPVGFADLKKRLGIESSGHLQHHLSKLGNLVKIDQDGRYGLSEHGKDALFAVQTVEKVTEPQTRGGGERFSRGAARLFLALAFLFLVAFTWLQIASMNDPNFLLLMFSSFVFLGAGTYLSLKTFSRSSEKRLCFAVAVVFIVVTLFVATSLAQFPRGGIWRYGISARPESFVLNVENSGGYYYGERSQIIYSAKYPVGFVAARTPWPEDRLLINVSNPVNLQGKVYVFLIFKPYEMGSQAFFQEPIAFNENSSLAHYEISLDVEWGNSWLQWSNGSRTRFERYELEFQVRLDLRGPETAPRYLNFTVDTTFLRISIDDFMVDSSFQNGLCVTLSGIFVGINAYVPGAFLLQHYQKKSVREQWHARDSD
jgi:DNA-binding HxlR family transcriptional regulator